MKPIFSEKQWEVSTPAAPPTPKTRPFCRGCYLKNEKCEQNKSFASKSCIRYHSTMKHVKQIAITARINPKIKKLADRFCASQGLIMSRFIEEAILDKLEEVGDAAEVATLRQEPVRSFNQVIKELKFLN